MNCPGGKYLTVKDDFLNYCLNYLSAKCGTNHLLSSFCLYGNNEGDVRWVKNLF